MSMRSRTKPREKPSGPSRIKDTALNAYWREAQRRHSAKMSKMSKTSRRERR